MGRHGGVWEDSTTVLFSFLVVDVKRVVEILVGSVEFQRWRTVLFQINLYCCWVFLFFFFFFFFFGFFWGTSMLSSCIPEKENDLQGSSVSVAHLTVTYLKSNEWESLNALGSIHIAQNIFPGGEKITHLWSSVLWLNRYTNTLSCHFVGQFNWFWGLPNSRQQIWC